MRFLLTGFAPFGQSAVNPSYEVLRLLPRFLGEHEIYTAEIPVTYADAPAVLRKAMEEVRPHCVLALGQAAGREGISLENTAVNVKASAAPDNAGVVFQGEKVEAEGPESLSVNLPLREMLAALQEEKIPAKISYSAGTYVCNTLFYSLLSYIEGENRSILGGFLHIPIDESQSADFPEGTPTMPISEVVRALRILLSVIADRNN